MDVSHLKDDQEIINLIFAAGFSTAEQLTAVSGRGVGMDAVKKSIHELGGDVGLTTKVGQGTTFSITLPLSMSVSKSLVVKVRDLLYAIPTKSIIFVEKISVHSLSKNGKDEFYRFNDELIPCYDLSRLFPDYRSERELPIISTHVCVTTVNGQHMALRVDEVVQTLSMVMKPLSRSVRKSALLSGVSLLPNGSPIFVLNIHECILMLLNHIRGDDNVRKSA